MDSAETLQKIIILLREKKQKQALELLAQLISEQPDNEEAWLLLGYTLDDPQKKNYAFQQVLKLNPNNDRAKKQLEKIGKQVAAPTRRSSALEELPAPEMKSRMVAVWATAMILLLIVALFIIAYIQGWGFSSQRLSESAGKPNASATIRPTLTPRPTSTTTNTPTKTATPTSTPLPTDTPTPLPLPPQVQTEIAEIQQQVSTIRGLPITEDVSNEIMPLLKLRLLMTDLLITDNYLDTLPDQELVLTALGFIYPDYNLVDATLNSKADAIGGFYEPEINKVNVIGTGFYGIEKLIYSHEYTHALADQHYKLDSLGIYPECTLPAQSCQAIRALVEGEAETVQWLWFDQHGTLAEQDLLRFTSYQSTLFTEDTPPPPYFGMQSLFAYLYGADFISYLVNRGGWALVDQAYTNKLPTTTEQILHPEVYLSGQGGLPVDDPDLSSTIGGEWRLVERDSLGEWDTYLLLSAGADEISRIQGDAALEAAAGWSGDTYQVLTNGDEDQTLLAAHWQMDSNKDQQELYEVLVEYMATRFRNATIDGPGNGSCWLYQEQFSCIYQSDRDVLWLLAPGLENMQTLKQSFPKFQ
jgi:hypothetical protein